MAKDTPSSYQEVNELLKTSWLVKSMRSSLMKGVDKAGTSCNDSYRSQMKDQLRQECYGWASCLF
ncbi:MAG: hypothetical protein PHG00_00135 [Methylococcales bacterium]|nr:hypothetical protein [Methylococcales bacterium]